MGMTMDEMGRRMSSDEFGLHMAREIEQQPQATPDTFVWQGA